MSEEIDNIKEVVDDNAEKNKGDHNNLHYDGKNKDNRNEKKCDCTDELCKVLDKLKEGLCADCGERKHSNRNSNDNRGEGSSSKEQPTEDQPTEDQPTENQPTENQPTENQPTENQPTENQPTEDQPTENQPTEDQPTEDQPTEDQPTENQPTENQPTENQPTENQPTENQPTIQNVFSIKLPCCIKVKFINRIKDACKRKNNERPERKSDMDFVDDELEKVRPKKPTHNKKCGCIVVLLVLCLFFPLILLFLRSFCPTQNAVILDNDKVGLASTTRSESNGDKSESSNNKIKGEGIVVFGTAVLDGENSHVKQNGKLDLVVERKQKESCCREILWGIISIVFIGGILCVIIIYIKFLREKQEREYDIDNSILEFNKRAYFELLKLRTSELVIKQMTKEQELELKKESELSNLDETHRSSDNEWKRESKRFDLQEKYLEKAAEVANKYFETHHVERTESDSRKEVTCDFDVDIERH